MGLSTQCSLCTQQIVGITCDVPCVMEDHLLPVIGWALSQIKNVFPSHQFQNCDHVFREIKVHVISKVRFQTSTYFSSHLLSLIAC